METKELKVQVPEGYEIDKENSTFEHIRFKPIKKDITYKDVCNALFVNDTYFTSDRGCIHKGARWDTEIIPDKNIATTEKQLKKLLALNQLLNIAEYYNKLHGNGVNSVIKYDKIKQIYVVTEAFTMYTKGIRAIFNKTDDAQSVIDNPNFREILDTVYKN